MTEETSIVVRDIATQELAPSHSMKQATNVAGACREIVLKTAQNIQGRKHVRVEGWRAIAMAYGCTISCRDVEKVEGGIRAIADVKRISDGLVIATAEGFVGDDEQVWQKRPLFARRAMAQTRASSRAGRTAFDFVVVMIDGGLSTTPAEEMGGEDSTPAPVTQDDGHNSDARVKRLQAAGKDQKLRFQALMGLNHEQRQKVIAAAEGGDAA